VGKQGIGDGAKASLPALLLPPLRGQARDR
jgi:hypothetical protein